jgi:hypothetical protein
MLLAGCPDDLLWCIRKGRLLRHDGDDDKLHVRVSVTDSV